MWSSGHAILVRYGERGEFRGARPVTVVDDGADFLVTWLAPGTTTAYPVLADGRPLRAVPAEERLHMPRAVATGSWRGAGILMIFPRDAAHSVWLFWHESGDFHGWYVNLEERHRRWHGGLDTRDQVLDLWCERPREWQWKDEDELELEVRHGRFTRAEAAAVRAEGERVAALIEAWAPPFSDGWERWRPDPSWPVPELPAEWREL